MPLTRRVFLETPVVGLFFAQSTNAQTGSAPTAAESFPAHAPATVLEMVTVSHGNVARVRELLSNRPALANAAWDWGFGDWESPLGAASHVGNREIATILLSAGARPTMFSAAMLGQLDVVKAFVTASPGVQRTRGPHGIPLLAHARAGGASEVVMYLESVQGANLWYRDEPLESEARAGCVGEYMFGNGPDNKLTVSAMERGGLLIRRGNGMQRNLFHLGGLVFHPAGAEAVRIRFAPGAPAPSLAVEDGPVVVEARRR